MRTISILILLMVSSLCDAQYSNHQLYQAYLERDMHVWQEYIASADWGNLSVEEQIQLLNYEYGFTAYMLGQNEEEAHKQILRYEQHLESLKGELSESRYFAYLSSVYTYKLGLDKKHLMKYASGIFDNIKRAIELDNNDALACSMQGNVEFYSPFGSKKKALAYYQRADSLYQEGAKEYEQWNRCAVQLTMVQCLIKQEKKKEAKRLCEQYIAKEPAFELMKQLLKQCD